MKHLFIFSITLLAFSNVTQPTFAHVIVTPSTVGIAKTVDFTVSVPNEKDNPIVTVQLLIPPGFSNVTPNATFGWTINTVTSNNNVTEIDWTDGSIPPRQREEFVFQAQAPDKVTTIPWKAYETYSDGTEVNWDINPKTLEKLSDTQQDTLADKENKGVYSTTQVINDLTIPPTANISQVQQVDQKTTTALIFAIAAIAIACISLSIARKKNGEKLLSKTSPKLSRSRKRTR